MSNQRHRFYLTTPIYYVTARPHIGTAYTTIACDALARYRRLRGDEVLFATGVDEHAQKVMRAAQAEGTPVQSFIDGYADAYRKTWAALHISNDRFIRTSDADHKATVQEVFRRLLATDDIYKADYQGWYCVPCETYFPESELVDGNCPDCGRPVEQLTQPAYFFRTSKYADALAEYIESHDGFILPESRRNEVLGFIRGGLRDACISRTGTDFGIKVPGDEDHTVYVWFDALINYLTVAGYPDLDPNTWPPQAQVMGKDILPRFHATIWPAMLMALGLPQPDMLFGHGWWVSEQGDKMSKSKGNVIEPLEVAADLSEISGCDHEVAVDAVRYFVLREVQFGLDGSFSQRALIGRFNADLANDLGNMLNRTLPLVERFLGGECRRPADHESAFGPLVADVCARVSDRMAVLDYRGSLEAIWELLAAGNKFIDEKQPWALHKQGKADEVAAVLYDALDLVRIVATLIAPFMPAVADEIWRQLGLEADSTLRSWDACVAGRLPESVCPQKGAPIFPRVDLAALEARQADSKKTAATKQKGKPKPAMITYEQFSQLDLRVGKVMDVEPVEGADKLYKLTVDVGEESGPRQLVPGLAQAFGARELLDAYVVVVANLEPATIRGVASNGMILAAGEKAPVALVTLDRECPLGSKIR
jgi:methionyl-tRNA synthetase